MSLSGNRPRLIISHGPKKKVISDLEPNLGNLTPDVQSNSLPSFQSASTGKEGFLKLGKYILFPQNEKEYLAINTQTQEELKCKEFPVGEYRAALSPYWQVDCHPHISGAAEVVVGASRAYAFFPAHHGDLHSYVRQRKRLREDEARRLFTQIVSAIAHCHENGVILRDLKLRKFVFHDADRTELQLEGLEDAVVLSEDAPDVLRDKHGCPAYVSPEILAASEAGYSGKSADVWSLGVMLYTMLVGRYPFHDSQPLALFGKIRRGHFHVPEGVSARAKCLIRCLLRRDPAQRLAVHEILAHPWFRPQPSLRHPPHAAAPHSTALQVVPQAPGPVPSAQPWDW